MRIVVVVVVVVVLVTTMTIETKERLEEEFTARFKVIRANYKSTRVGRRDLFLALRTHHGLDTTDLLPVWTLTFIYESSRPIVIAGFLASRVFHFAKFSSN